MKIRKRKFHGMSHTRVAHIWRQMRYRCSNPNAPEFKNYGERGISVSEDWNDFSAFYADMGDPPTNKHTLERLDVNGGYNKENCVWATYTEQHRNRRNNTLVTAFGKTQCVASWADEFGINQRTLHNRLFRAKMNPEDALRMPVKPK